MNSSTLPNTFVLQRCTIYGYRPEGTSIQSNPIKIKNLNLPNLRNATVRACFRSYKNRPSFHDAAKDLQGDVFSFLRFGREIGFWVGDKVYIEGVKGDAVGKFYAEYPHEGQVDLYLSIEGEEGTDINTLRELLVPYLSSSIMLLSYRTTDLIVPHIHIDAATKVNDQWQAAHGLLIDSQRIQRRTISPHQLASALQEFARFIEDTTIEDILRLDKAARRIMTAKKERDLIDRFCDLWETCEFLCPKTKTLYGHIDRRVAIAFSKCTDFKQHLLWQHIVKPIYDIRCDIVHNAIENIQRCTKAITILVSES